MLFLGAICWVGLLVARQLGESVVYDRLLDTAASVHQVFASGPPGQEAPDRSWPARRLPPEFARVGSGDMYVLRYAPERSVQSPSAAGLTLNPPMLAPGEARRGRQVLDTGDVLLYWVGGYSDRGQAVTVAVYSDTSSFYRRLGLAARLAVGAVMSLLLVLLLIQHLILRRTTSRLDAIRADIERLGHGEILALPEDVPDEVQPLVVEFNQLLQRFDHRLRQSRNAVGNLAHALKGPLNLLIRAADDTPEAPAIQQNASRIRQLIDGELRRARLVGRTSTGRRFDLRAEIETLADLLAQVHTGKQIEVRLAEGSGVEILHDRQDMLELIGNLLDNAFKWAGSLVMVNAREANGLLLEIEDDGPGASDAELARLTDRGVRLDESIDGHGLGLAIVKDIVATYKGELELQRSVRLGGLRVSVHLPEHDTTGDAPFATGAR